MALKLEVGKYYRTRDGRRVGVVAKTTHHIYQFRGDNGHSYTLQGKVWEIKQVPSDLISEWPSEGPVRTVTRKEIVPGVYGDVEVAGYDARQGGIGVYINAAMDAGRIRAAIATLTEIAAALEESE